MSARINATHKDLGFSDNNLRKRLGHASNMRLLRRSRAQHRRGSSQRAKTSDNLGAGVDGVEYLRASDAIDPMARATHGRRLRPCCGPQERSTRTPP